MTTYNMYPDDWAGVEPESDPRPDAGERLYDPPVPYDPKQALYRAAVGPRVGPHFAVVPANPPQGRYALRSACGDPDGSVVLDIAQVLCPGCRAWYASGGTSFIPEGL